MNEVPPYKPGGHTCELFGESAAYGAAITEMWEDPEGRFWVGNGEYASQVAYCPACGAKAPTQPAP